MADKTDFDLFAKYVSEYEPDYREVSIRFCMEQVRWGRGDDEIVTILNDARSHDNRSRLWEKHARSAVAVARKRVADETLAAMKPEVERGNRFMQSLPDYKAEPRRQPRKSPRRKS